MTGGVAQIGIDHQNPSARLGEDKGGIDHGDRFSLSLHTAGKENGFRRLSSPGKQNSRADRPVRLGDNSARMVGGNKCKLILGDSGA
jgi:hypothetical protein